MPTKPTRNTFFTYLLMSLDAVELPRAFFSPSHRWRTTERNHLVVKDNWKQAMLHTHVTGMGERNFGFKE